MSKPSLRASVAAALSSITPAQRASQSAAVLEQLRSVPAFASCTGAASIYLPMEGACNEVDTWPIVADLLARGVRVAVPRVCGRSPTDMKMLGLSGDLEAAKALPRTKWGIPEPDEAAAASMEDLTESEDLSLLLVPGVAFDARCGRLGHGRGYYDAFISQQRRLQGGGRPQVIGLALNEQIVEAVPMGELDERLDAVVSPQGELRFTSEADGAKAARLLQRGEGAPAESPAEGAGEAAVLSSRVEIAVGRFKYACLRVSPPRGGAPFLAVRSGRGYYHADVAEAAIDRFEALGYRCEPLGGGRIVRSDGGPGGASVHIYGYSVGFGGAEGGPPGRGMRDHAAVAELVAQALPSHSVTHSSDGY